MQNVTGLHVWRQCGTCRNLKEINQKGLIKNNQDHIKHQNKKVKFEAEIDQHDDDDLVGVLLQNVLPQLLICVQRNWDHWGSTNKRKLSTMGIYGSLRRFTTTLILNLYLML